MNSAESSQSNDSLTSPNDSLIIARRAGKKPEACVRRGKAPVTNGNQTFTLGGDGHSPWARRWKDVTAQLVLDLGGRDFVSEFQLALCKRAASLTVELESLEAAMSEGQIVDLDLFGRLVGHLRRILESLSPGLGRVARVSDTLDLSTYAQQVRGAYRFADDPANTSDPAIVDDTADISGAPADATAKPYGKSPPAPAALSVNSRRGSR